LIRKLLIFCKRKLTSLQYKLIKNMTISYLLSTQLLVKHLIDSIFYRSVRADFETLK